MRIELNGMTLRIEEDENITTAQFTGGLSLSLGDIEVQLSKQQAVQVLRELIGEYPKKARVLLAEEEDQDRTLEEIDARIARGEAAFPNIERALGERQLTQVNSSEAVGAHA